MMRREDLNCFMFKSAQPLLAGINTNELVIPLHKHGRCLEVFHLGYAYTIREMDWNSMLLSY